MAEIEKVPNMKEQLAAISHCVLIMQSVAPEGTALLNRVWQRLTLFRLMNRKTYI
jgi:hypothetical protein